MILAVLSATGLSCAYVSVLKIKYWQTYFSTLCHNIVDPDQMPVYVAHSLCSHCFLKSHSVQCKALVGRSLELHLCVIVSVMISLYSNEIKSIFTWFFHLF